MLAKLITSLLFFISVLGTSQVLSYDVVSNKLSQITDHRSFCDSTLHYAQKLFMNRQVEESSRLLLDAIEVAENDNLTDKLVLLYMKEGRCKELIGTLDEAIDLTYKAIDHLSEETASFEGKLYNFIGRYYQKKDQLDSMMYYYTKTEEWNNKNEPYRNWVLYEQWHHKYIELGDYNKAEELLLKSYHITKPKSIRMDHGMLLLQIEDDSK